MLYVESTNSVWERRLDSCFRYHVLMRYIYADYLHNIIKYSKLKAKPPYQFNGDAGQVVIALINVYNFEPKLELYNNTRLLVIYMYMYCMVYFT